MNQEVLLSLKDVSKAYGEVQAVKSVSIEVFNNEFFALLGPSGCGKTTLLRAIAGFESLDSGSMMLDGKNLANVQANHRPVNLMFQSYALFPHLNVWDNIAFGLRREGLPKSEITDRVSEVLETIGLGDQATRRPAQLSGGQRQRVALARAIVKRPRMLLLDEPLSALDRKVRAEMQIELKRLQHEFGITFVVVTHDQEEAMSMADRIAVMQEGTVAQIASPVELYERPNSVFVADFIGNSNMISAEVSDGLVRARNGVEITKQGEYSGPSSVMCVIRPESLRFSEQGLPGRVISTHFYGGDSLVVVDCGLDQPLKISSPGPAKVTSGDTCNLAWDSTDVLVLANE